MGGIDVGDVVIPGDYVGIDYQWTQSSSYEDNPELYYPQSSEYLRYRNFSGYHFPSLDFPYSRVKTIAGAWGMADIGSPKIINGFMIDGGIYVTASNSTDPYYDHGKMQYSEDGINWTNITEGINNYWDTQWRQHGLGAIASPVGRYFSEPIYSRYLRFYWPQGTGADLAVQNLWIFESAPTFNLVPSNAPSALIDNNVGTAVNVVVPMTSGYTRYVLDCGEPKTVNTVRYAGNNISQVGSGAVLELSVSNDGTNWTNIIALRGASGLIDDHIYTVMFADLTYRYWAIGRQNVTTSDYSFELQEFQILYCPDITEATDALAP